MRCAARSAMCVCVCVCGDLLLAAALVPSLVGGFVGAKTALWTFWVRSVLLLVL